MDTVVHQHGILVRYSLRCRKPVQTAVDVSVVFLRTTGVTVGYVRTRLAGSLGKIRQKQWFLASTST